MKNKNEILERIKVKENRICLINDMAEGYCFHPETDGAFRLAMLEIAFTKKEIETLNWIIDGDAK